MSPVFSLLTSLTDHDHDLFLISLNGFLKVVKMVLDFHHILSGARNYEVI